MANKLELPQDPKLAAKVIDGEQSHQLRLADMGWIGRFLGGGAEKPGNVAWVVITLSFVFLGVVFVTGNSENIDKAITLFGGLISGSLGFLFGRAKS